MSLVIGLIYGNGADVNFFFGYAECDFWALGKRILEFNTGIPPSLL